MIGLPFKITPTMAASSKGDKHRHYGNLGSREQFPSSFYTLFAIHSTMDSDGHFSNLVAEKIKTVQSVQKNATECFVVKCFLHRFKACRSCHTVEAVVPHGP